MQNVNSGFAACIAGDLSVSEVERVGRVGGGGGDGKWRVMECTSDVRITWRYLGYLPCAAFPPLIPTLM